jgi:hypothetical protein
MDLRMSDDEARTLQGLLRDYLPELKFGVARSDPGPLRLMDRSACHV